MRANITKYTKKELDELTKGRPSDKFVVEHVANEVYLIPEGQKARERG